MKNQFLQLFKKQKTCSSCGRQQSSFRSWSHRTLQSCNELIDDKIQNIRYIDARRAQPYPPARLWTHPRGAEVSVVLDLMIHDIENILHIVNSKIKYVEATGYPILSNTEDIANARITFKNGCVANITASRISDKSVRKTVLYQTTHISHWTTMNLPVLSAQKEKMK